LEYDDIRLPSLRRKHSSVSIPRRDEVLAIGHCEAEGCDSTDRLTIDHIIPLAKGGTNERVNLQCLCYSCNIIKRDRLGCVNCVGKVYPCEECRKKGPEEQTLTNWQYRVLESIQDFILEMGWSPTVDEVAMRLDMSTRQSALSILGHLCQRGVIKRNKRKKRGIRVTEKGRRVLARDRKKDVTA